MIFKITTRLKIFIFILCMGIPNFAQETIEEKVEVQIKIIDLNNTVVFNKSKVLLLKKVDNRLSIRLDELQPGDYYILVDVKDLGTNKTRNEQKKVSLK